MMFKNERVWIDKILFQKNIRLFVCPFSVIFCFIRLGVLFCFLLITSKIHLACSFRALIDVRRCLCALKAIILVWPCHPLFRDSFLFD